MLFFCWLDFNAESQLSPKSYWQGPRSLKVMEWGGVEWGRGGSGEEGGRGKLYVTLHCQHQNDSCIQTGSDEGHFCFINCEGRSHKTVSTDHNV